MGLGSPRAIYARAPTIARAINRTYNITQRVASYFLLNGRSYPDTVQPGPMATQSVRQP